MEEKEKTSEAPETQETTATTTKAVRLKKSNIKDIYIVCSGLCSVDCRRHD